MAVVSDPAVLIELRRAWLASGMTQQDIADLTGMPRPNVARAVNGKHMPTLMTLVRLADALGLEVTLTRRSAEEER